MQDVAARENDEVNVGHMTVVADNGGSEGGNIGEVIETVVTDVNKNDGKLMICEVSGLHYFSCYLLCGAIWKPWKLYVCRSVLVIIIDCSWLQNAMKVYDGNKCLENPDSKVVNMEADKDLAVDCHVRILSL